MENKLPQSSDRQLIQAQVFIIMLLLAFTIVISWRLMAGNITFTQGYLWMGICCLCPIIWYILGYLKSKDKKESNALIISAIGWIFVAMGFLEHYNKLLSVAPGTLAADVSDPLITIFLLLGLLVIVVGGFLSWQAATKPHLTDTISSQ